MRTEESFAGISVPPGDPDGVGNLARSYVGVAANLRSTASRLRASPGEMPSWQGAASVAYMGLALIAGEDADEAAGRMERAAEAATKYRDELVEARADAREAIREARDAQDRVDKANKHIAAAEKRLTDARQRQTTAANRIMHAAGGAVPSGAEADLEVARRDAERAEEDIRQGRRSRERAVDDRERAQKRGKRASERAEDSAGLLKGALLAASPGVIGLSVGAPAMAPGASAAGLDGASPAQVATFFRRIGPEGGERVARTHPELVGGLDGAPLPLRYQANRSLAAGEASRLRDELESVESELADERDGGIDFPRLVSPLPITLPAERVHDALTTSREEELEARRGDLSKELKTAEAFAADGRKLLLYDPRGDGQVAEVFGDLPNAQHATVLVPGIGNDMAGFDEEFRGEAQDLHGEADLRSGGRAATVAWLGYDSPTGPVMGFGNPDTFTNEVAYAGGESLARSLDGINAQNPGAHTTVAGHSYGSVVTGQAAAHHGLRVDDVVLTGSPGPGTGVDHASDLSRGGEARVWSAAAPGDRVADPPSIPDPSALPGPYPQLGGLVHDGLRELGEVHGPNPAAAEFGARRFDTGPPLEPLVDSTEVDVPLIVPQLGPVGELPVPVPTDVNPDYLIDQHTEAYSSPETDAFQNLVSIAIGERGEVTPAR